MAELRQLKQATMNRIGLLILTMVLVTSCSIFPRKGKKKLDTFVPGEIMITMQDSESLSSTEALLAKHELSIKETIASNLKIYLIAVPEGQELFWVEKLRKEPTVKGADLNYYTYIL